MDTKVTPRFRAALLHPRYWKTWFLFGLWWLVSQLPYPVLMLLGRGLGKISYRFLKQRRFIARRNLELCFPELSAKEREHLLKENFIATGKAVFETGMGWFWPHWRLRRLCSVEGVEHIQTRQDKNEGILMLCLHFTTLEIMGAVMNGVVDSIAMTYRPHRNPVYDWIQSRQRRRCNPSAVVVAAGDVRSMVRHLRRGQSISYLPDQDYGPKHSVFVPFFGVSAATVTGLARLAQMSKASVIPVFSFRRPDGKGYIVRVLPPFENFPAGDEVRDARKLNEHVEDCIRQCPEQYLWAHRRFKSRPPGEADVYGLPKRQRRRRKVAR